jgi:hypothetical protein
MALVALSDGPSAFLTSLTSRLLHSTVVEISGAEEQPADNVLTNSIGICRLHSLKRYATGRSRQRGQGKSP